MAAKKQQQQQSGSTRDEIIDTRSAADVGSISVSTLHRLRKRGVGFPEPVPLPIQSFRFRRSEVERFFGIRPPQESGS